ncbi:MAG TPA: Gfo/Idh/MocA family oxidoreductase [Thermoanaerobaculia bacterium]|nr:Gfo/Idh/MocA family oxidoreductase [Thermoanaerobaculia bacterium]
MGATDVVGVGLIGHGKAGKIFHEPLIRATDGLELKRIARRADAGALIDDESIELVVVATPNTSHFDLARQALLARKHVVVDKPFTITSAEAAELIAVARNEERLLTVFHNRRWEGDFLTVRRLIDQNAFGRLLHYEARFDRFRNEARPGAWRETPEPGSGVLYDLGSHLIDQVLLLFGEPERITADVRRERDFARTDDAFDIWMHYPRMKVTLTAGMLIREKTPRYVVRGTKATFIKYGLDPQEADLAAGRSPRDSGWGREPREQWGTLISDNGERTIETLPGNYRAFYENVRDVLAGRAESAVTAEQAKRTIEVIEEIRPRD